MTENKRIEFLAREKYEEAWNYLITALERIESAACSIGLCNSVHVEGATNNLSRAANHIYTAYNLYKESFDILTLACDDEDEQTVYQSEEEINEALCDPDIMGIDSKIVCRGCFYFRSERINCPSDSGCCNQATHFYKFLHKDTGE